MQGRCDNKFKEMEKQKTLLLYQKLSKRLDTVEAIMSKMTLHEINQRSEYFETQLEEMDDLDVHLNVALYLPDDAEFNMNFETYVKGSRYWREKSQKLNVKTVLWMGRSK